MTLSQAICPQLIATRWIACVPLPSHGMTMAHPKIATCVAAMRSATANLSWRPFALASAPKVFVHRRSRVYKSILFETALHRSLFEAWNLKVLWQIVSTRDKFLTHLCTHCGEKPFAGNISVCSFKCATESLIRSSIRRKRNFVATNATPSLYIRQMYLATSGCTARNDRTHLRQQNNFQQILIQNYQ